MGCGMVLLSAIFVAAVVGQVIGQDVGNCNLTFFTTGAQQCQRTTMLSLKNNSSLNCSDEYPEQSSCVEAHVGTCLQGTLYSAFQSEIVKLPKLLLYHCGSLGYQPSSINPVVLDFVECNGNDLDDMITCWDEFQSAFDANRSDPSLCRKFAEGKEKCTDIAKKACPGICEYITKDAYNPFCNSTVDPAGTSNLFDCIASLGCSDTLIYENAVNCEKSSFEAFANGSGISCSVALENNKDCLRQNLVSQCPAMQKKEEIFEDVVKTLRATMMSQQFFCEKVTLDTSSIDELVTTADCKPKFFTDVETVCAEPFRNIYLNAAEKKSPDVCNAFAGAKKCLNKAHEDNCNFALSTRQAAMFGEENPFCESGNDPQQHSPSSWAQVTTLLLFISSFAGLWASIP